MCRILKQEGCEAEQNRSKEIEGTCYELIPLSISVIRVKDAS